MIVFAIVCVIVFIMCVCESEGYIFAAGRNQRFLRAVFHADEEERVLCVTCCSS